MRQLVTFAFLSPLILVACDSGDDAAPTDDGGGGDQSAENTSAACRDGLDNDGDGRADCDDPECADFVFCVSADADADAPDTDASDTEANDNGDDGLLDADADASEEDEGGDEAESDADGEDAEDGGPACAPGDDGCGPDEICDDGLDNDCDGTVDEADAGCSCTYGQVQACLPGPPCGRGVGGCVEGWQACAADGTWRPCAEAILGEDELPDGKDNDCDGEIDEGLSATPTIICPIAYDTFPGRYWVLRCEDFCSASAGGPCDCSWSIRSPEGSGTFEVPDRLAETTRVYLDVAGTFVITATILDPALDTWRCSFAVRAVPVGVQVDLWWDDPDPWQPGNLDLHVHRKEA